MKIVFRISGLVFTLIFLIACLFGCASSTKNTVLHKSVEKNDAEAARKAILSVSSIDEYDEYGRTALHLAVLKNNPEMVKLLIESGAEINRVSYYGHTPLSLSMRYEDLEVTNILLKAGASIDKENTVSSPLIEAIKFGRIDLSKKLLDMGAKVQKVDRYNCTALYYAAYFGLNGLVCELIAKGADPNHRSIEGMSAVHAAAFAEEKETVGLLLNNGAKLFAEKEYEKGVYSTAMMYQYASELFHSNGQNDEALLACNKSEKFQMAAAELFNNRENEIKNDTIRQGFTTLLKMMFFFSIYDEIGRAMAEDQIKNRKGFFSESTDFQVSGIRILRQNHPECFSIEEHNKGPNKDPNADIDDPYTKIALIKRNLYKCMAQQCLLHSMQCKNKLKITGTNSETLSSTVSDREPLPPLRELEMPIQENVDYVNLTIYQKPHWATKGLIVYFFINDYYIGNMKDNEYIVVKVQPGKHTIKVAYHITGFECVDFVADIEINVDGQKTDYFLESINEKKVPLKIVTKEIAYQEMASMRLAHFKLYD